MSELYVLVQERLGAIGAALAIGLAAWFYGELVYDGLNAGFKTRWKNTKTLRGKVVRRRHLPAQKTLTLIDNVYSYIPVHTLESEKYILDIEACGRCYQVEASEAEFRALSVGDRVTIHHRGGLII
ncbi:hypothetical protein VSX61_11920 [Brenneria populi subsp. brevivirga]|uniref:hypothetical protein n=1 Tax=Brenneria populi TaxID=1505588 RepID=UPI002E1932A8|nr:hypothetical protein [Brenneria populi subsp. brevivirga]